MDKFILSLAQAQPLFQSSQQLGKQQPTSSDLSKMTYSDSLLQGGLMQALHKWTSQKKTTPQQHPDEVKPEENKQAVDVRPPSQEDIRDDAIRRFQRGPLTTPDEGGLLGQHVPINQVAIQDDDPNNDPNEEDPLIDRVVEQAPINRHQMDRVVDQLGYLPAFILGSGLAHMFNQDNIQVKGGVQVPLSDQQIMDRDQYQKELDDQQPLRPTCRRFIWYDNHNQLQSMVICDDGYMQFHQ